MPIDPQIFDLIRSSNVEERKKGVKALARTEDREALRYLASLYNQDPDPEVRDLALKAGQHIKKRGELAEWGSDQGKHTGKFQDVEIKRDASKQQNKLPDNAKTREAKALMDQAMDKMMMSEYAEAQDLAYEAFALVPNLDADSYYASLASEIMGMPQAQAIATLKAGREDYSISGKSKRKRGSGGSEASWTDFLVDTAILYIVSTGTMLFFMFIVFNQLQGLAEAGVFGSSYSQYGTVDPTAEIMNFMSTTGMTMLIIVSLIFGIIMVFFNLLHFVVLHFCATALGGNGSFRALVHQSVIPLTINSIVSVAITGATYYFTFQAIINAGGDPNAMMYDRQAINTANSLNALSLLAGLVYTLWLSHIIGKVYDFGFGKGCGTIIVSIIAFVVVGCGCGFMLSMMASGISY